MTNYHYIFEGEEVSLRDLFEHNPDFEAMEREAILALRPGECLDLGGGAVGPMILRCESQPSPHIQATLDKGAAQGRHIKTIHEISKGMYGVWGNECDTFAVTGDGALLMHSLDSQPGLYPFYELEDLPAELDEIPDSITADHREAVERYAETFFPAERQG